MKFRLKTDLDIKDRSVQLTPPSSDIDGNYGAGPAFGNYAITYVFKAINTRSPGLESLTLLRVRRISSATCARAIMSRMQAR